MVTRHVEGAAGLLPSQSNVTDFPDLQRILLKTPGATDIIRRARAAVGDAIEIAFIYGSAARGTAGAGSDVDLFVVGRVAFSDLVTTLAPAQRDLGREINPTVYSREEVQKEASSRHHFLNSILRDPKIVIAGTENDLGRLAEVRLVDASPTSPRGIADLLAVVARDLAEARRISPRWSTISSSRRSTRSSRSSWAPPDA